jgi:hypothetical protein
MPVIYVEDSIRTIVRDECRSYNMYTPLNEGMPLEEMALQTMKMIEIRWAFVGVSLASCSVLFNHSCPGDNIL